MKKKDPKIVPIGEVQEEHLRNMFQEYYLEGCQLSVDGKKAQPWQVTESCMREKGNYMMDFIPDSENKRIIHINLVHVIDDRDLGGAGCIGWCG